MRIFITGPLGYIGKPLLHAFLTAGHRVSGLVRSDEKASLLRRLGADPVIGDLAHPHTYAAALDAAEAIIHCAMDSSSAAVDTETAAVEAMLDKRYLPSTGSKAFIYTSGVWVYGNTGAAIADEGARLDPLELVRWRVDVEEKVLDAASRQFRTLVLRPGCVYGSGGSLTALWFSSALRGAVEIVGPGGNRWAMIHQDDLAHAYLLAVEKEINGIALNIVDGTRNTVLDMAVAVSKVSGVPGMIAPLDKEAAERKYGKLAEGLLVDQQISGERAQRLLGWHPRHRPFIEGVEEYYNLWRTSQIK